MNPTRLEVTRFFLEGGKKRKRERYRERGETVVPVDNVSRGPVQLQERALFVFRRPSTRAQGSAVHLMQG